MNFPDGTIILQPVGASSTQFWEVRADVILSPVQQVPVGSYTLNVSSRTPTDFSEWRTRDIAACNLVHGTLHAVLGACSNCISPSTEHGSVTLDATF